MNSTSKENSKKYCNPPILLAQINSKKKWSTRSLTQLKTKRKHWKIFKNTKSISKRIWIFSKNITKKQMKNWILISSSIKLKITILSQNAISESSKLQKRKESFMNSLILPKKHNLWWINYKNKLLMISQNSPALPPTITIANLLEAFLSLNTKKINKKMKKVVLKCSENKSHNLICWNSDNPLTKSEKCLTYKKLLGLELEI